MDFIYQLPGIVRDGEMGWGLTEFSLGYLLDGDAAGRLRDMEMTDDVCERLQSRGRDIIGTFPKILTDMEVPKNPYLFLKGSSLLHGVSVPGDACDLSLDESGRDEFGSRWEKVRLLQEGERPSFVMYTWHNTGIYVQAIAQRELFLDWANYAYVLLNPVS